MRVKKIDWSKYRNGRKDSDRHWKAQVEDAINTLIADTDCSFEKLRKHKDEEHKNLEIRLFGSLKKYLKKETLAIALSIITIVVACVAIINYLS